MTAKMLASVGALAPKSGQRVVKLNQYQGDIEVSIALVTIVSELKDHFNIDDYTQLMADGVINPPRLLKIYFLIQHIEAVLQWPKNEGHLEENFMNQLNMRLSSRFWDRRNLNSIMRLLNRMNSFDSIEHQKLFNHILKVLGNEACLKVRNFGDLRLSLLFSCFSRNCYRDKLFLSTFLEEFNRRYMYLSSEILSNLMFGYSKIGLVDEAIPRFICQKIEQNPDSFKFSSSKIAGTFVELGYSEQDWCKPAIGLMLARHRKELLDESSDCRLAHMLFIMVNVDTPPEAILRYIECFNNADKSSTTNFYKLLMYEYFKINPTSIPFGTAQDYRTQSKVDPSVMFGIKVSLFTELNALLSKGCPTTHTTSQGIYVPIYLPGRNLTVMPITQAMETIEGTRKKSCGMYADLIEKSGSELFQFRLVEFMEVSPSSRKAWLQSKGLNL